MAEDQVRGVRWRHVIMLGLSLGLVLAFIAGVIAALYFGVLYLGLQAALAWAAFIVLLLLLMRIEVQRKHEQQRLLADRRREVYFELLNLLQKCFFSLNPVQAALKHKQELQTWSMRLALMGSDEVCRAWRTYYELAMGEFEEDEEDEQEDPEDEPEDEDDVQYEQGRLFAAQVRLLAALRRDCGHLRTTLTRWDLMEMLAEEETP